MKERGRRRDGGGQKQEGKEEYEKEEDLSGEDSWMG